MYVFVDLFFLTNLIMFSSIQQVWFKNRRAKRREAVENKLLSDDDCSEDDAELDVGDFARWAGKMTRNFDKHVCDLIYELELL